MEFAVAADEAYRLSNRTGGSNDYARLNHTKEDRDMVLYRACEQLLAVSKSPAGQTWRRSQWLALQ